MTRRRPRSAIPTAMAVARFSTSMRRRRMSRIASSERLTVWPSARWRARRPAQELTILGSRRRDSPPRREEMRRPQ